MAKIIPFTDAAGNDYPEAYANTKYYPINLRRGQQSVSFWFDVFKNKAAADAGLAAVGHVEVKVPTERIPAYIAAHLGQKRTIPELAYAALDEVGSVEGASPDIAAISAGKDDVDTAAIVSVP